MLPNSLQGTGWPPQQIMIQPKMSTAVSLKNSTLQSQAENRQAWTTPGNTVGA